MKLINDKKHRGILVVGDDKRIVGVLKEILHEADYKNVFTSYSGAEALGELVANKDLIYVILLDIEIPGLARSDVVEYLSSAHKVPVGIIFLTDSATEESSAEFLKLSYTNVTSVGYIKKPFKPSKLVAEINKALDLTHQKRKNHFYALTNINENIHKINENIHKINERIIRIEKKLLPIDNIESLRQGIGSLLRKHNFFIQSGFGLIRIIIIALAILGLLYLNVDDFMIEIINELKK